MTSSTNSSRPVAARTLEHASAWLFPGRTHPDHRRFRKKREVSLTDLAPDDYEKSPRPGVCRHRTAGLKQSTRARCLLEALRDALDELRTTSS